MNYAPIPAAIAIAILTAACACASQTPDDTASEHAARPGCTNSPCANTATGEGPQEIALHEGLRARSALAQGKPDKARWALSMYSSSTKPERLELYLVKSANLMMTLVPESGRLRFDHNGKVNVFQIEEARKAKNTMCPKYAVKVIDASGDHAVVSKSCLEYEYEPGRYVKGAAYYLYDRATRTMRTFWQSRTHGKDDPFPAPETLPTIARVKDGYDVRWHGTYVTNGRMLELSLNNRYLRTSLNGTEMGLTCTDLGAAKDEGLEGGNCEGTKLELVSSE